MAYMPCRQRCKHCRAIRPSLHTPLNGFTAIEVTCLRRSRPVQTSPHPGPATCGASQRNDSETHVPLHHVPGEGASAMCSAKGTTEAISSTTGGIKQRNENQTYLQPLQSLMHWTHGARIKKIRGKLSYTPLYMVSCMTSVYGRNVHGWKRSDQQHLVAVGPSHFVLLLQANNIWWLPACRILSWHLLRKNMLRGRYDEHEGKNKGPPQQTNYYVAPPSPATQPTLNVNGVADHAAGKNQWTLLSPPQWLMPTAQTLCLNDPSH